MKGPKVYVFGLLFIGGIISISSEVGLQRHINSIAAKNGNTGSSGCRKKPLENIALIGIAKACTSSKPLKLTGVLKMGKNICATNWNICSMTDKAVQKLSWKTEKMPKGCFAFNYGKSKAAGFGQNCTTNLYFDGLLCCPAPGSKLSNPDKAIPYNKEKLHHHQKFNLVK